MRTAINSSSSFNVMAMGLLRTVLNSSVDVRDNTVFSRHQEKRLDVIDVGEDRCHFLTIGQL